MMTNDTGNQFSGLNYNEERKKQLVENECLEGNEIVTKDVVESELHIGVPIEDETSMPVIGMKFQNYDKVFEFYKKYAARVGFPVRKRSARKDKDGIIKNAMFTCSREGQKMKSTSATFKPQPTIKNGCEARLTACSDITGTWKITGVHLEHNHAISPSKSRLYRCHRMVYCEIISKEDGCEKFLRGHEYMVQEDVICNGKKYKKFYIVQTQKESGNFVCSCHLFEFRGIICKHAITVLIRNDVTSVPDMYMLRRWRRDVCRSYQRVKINYDGWISTPDQLRYDNLCRAFAVVADKVANDDVRASKLMEWIGSVSNDLDLMNMDQRSEEKSNLDQSILVDSVNRGVDTILGPKISDPNHVKRKGAPRKLRQKGALEKISKKLKVSSKQKNMASSKPHESATYVQPMYLKLMPSPSDVLVD
ncbi:FAR1-related sequence 4, partial [Striga asiatica]